jgi:hypothetical protein
LTKILGINGGESIERTDEAIQLDQKRGLGLKMKVPPTPEPEPVPEPEPEETADIPKSKRASDQAPEPDVVAEEVEEPKENDIKAETIEKDDEFEVKQ